MKRSAMAMVLAMVAMLAAFAQSSHEKTAKGAGTEQALKDLETRWTEALAKGDSATLDSILAAGYVETDETGNLNERQALFNALKSGDLKFDSCTVADMQVHVYGDAAVVTGSGAQQGTYKGKALPTKIRFTDTFVKQGGKWKAVASHLSVPAEGA